MKNLTGVVLVVAGTVSANGQAIMDGETCSSLGFTGNGASANLPHVCFEALFSSTDDMNMSVVDEKLVGIGNATGMQSLDAFNQFFGAGTPPVGLESNTPFSARFNASGGSTFSSEIGLKSQLGDSSTTGNNSMTIAMDTLTQINISGPDTGFNVDVLFEAEGSFERPDVANNGFFSLFIELGIDDLDGGGSLFEAGGSVSASSSFTPFTSGNSLTSGDLSQTGPNSFNVNDSKSGSFSSTDGNMNVGVDLDASTNLFSDGFESGDTTAWTSNFDDTFKVTLSSTDPSVTFSVVVPEPRTYALIVGTLCLGLGVLRRRLPRYRAC